MVGTSSVITNWHCTSSDEAMRIDQVTERKCVNKKREALRQNPEEKHLRDQQRKEKEKWRGRGRGDR